MTQYPLKKTETTETVTTVLQGDTPRKKETKTGIKNNLKKNGKKGTDIENFFLSLQ